ncbi:MAG: hypothetical protein KBS54_01005, partial [Synergistaceae bacterium]|nr:hypothetical protein [Candidatus Equadaptatus faecalis]
RQGKQEPCKLRTENERTAQATSAPSPVGSNPEFDERRTQNVGTIEMRNNAFLNCSSFVVLSSSFVFNTLAPKGHCLLYPKAILGKIKTAWEFLKPFLV